MKKITKRLLTTSLAVCIVLGFPINMSGAQAAYDFNKSCMITMSKNAHNEYNITRENKSNISKNIIRLAEVESASKSIVDKFLSEEDNTETENRKEEANNNFDENNEIDIDINEANNTDNSNKNDIENEDILPESNLDISDIEDINTSNIPNINCDKEAEKKSENMFIENVESVENEKLNEMQILEDKDLKDEIILAEEISKRKELNNTSIRSGKTILKSKEEGVFDYRSWIDNIKSPQIDISIIKDLICDSDFEEYNQFTDQEKSELTYTIDISDENIIYADNLEISHAECNGIVPFYINSVGKAKLTISPKGNGYEISPCEIDIIINNSTLYDSDFYIELSQQAINNDKDLSDQLNISKSKNFDFEAWLKYLEQHDHWVNGEINAVISDKGKPFFECINMEINGTGKQSYTLWAENSIRNASTKNEENGTRTFVAGIDIEAPKISNVEIKSEFYEPTKTDTEQYYSENFIIDGLCIDTVSGIKKVEYTTDFEDRDNIKWHEAELCAPIDYNAKESYNEMPFKITLSDGIYNAIAIRVYDNAGNISIPWKFKNEKEEFIKVIVDKSKPVIQINAVSNGLDYNGNNDNWTNKDVLYNISIDKTSCSYAGIYEYEYFYEKIGDTIKNTKEKDILREWEQLQCDDSNFGSLEIHEDKNGYYYFQAVSKSGVSTDVPVSHRILIQHDIAKLKPIQETCTEKEKCKNGWYNKASGVPKIQFEYPEYDAGAVSCEYDAPVTIHYMLSINTNSDSNTNDNQYNTKYHTNNNMDSNTEIVIENSMTKGILSSDDTYLDSNNKNVFKITEDALNNNLINFSYDKSTGYAKDGIYTLTYWLTDKAGNKSDKQSVIYKIDTHEPANLTVNIADEDMPIDNDSYIVYSRFYQKGVLGTTYAEYGISGKSTIKVLKARRINEWQDISESNFDNGESFDITADRRCILYVRAEDNAGNISEGWTKGIIVDSKAPNETSKKELIIEPEGANEHGFFNGDIDVKISVKDSPENDNCAALMTVRSYIGTNDNNSVTEKELFSFTKEFPTDSELSAASSYEGIQTINALANESNETFIEVTAIDRSGNTKVSRQVLKVDVTKPKIEIVFDTDNAVNERYYNHNRSATIYIDELNFDDTEVKLNITKDDEPISINLSEWSHDGNKHWATIDFCEDGDYTIEAYCTDLAGNQSDIIQALPFTIDKTAPQVSIELRANNEISKYNEYYFNTSLTATITVAEHNFDSSDFALNVMPISKNVIWAHDGDIHTASIIFDEDNTYLLQCACIDRAGNTANGEFEKEFILDTAAPNVIIEGVLDGSANSGNITPIIYVFDNNIAIEDIAISVVTGTGKIVDMAIDTQAINNKNEMGYKFILSDMNAKKDNIYRLTVTAVDKAGNENTITYKFSLNRNGSAYDLENLGKLIDKQYHNYENIEDIEIIEMNIDKIEDFQVYISKNGELGYPAIYTKNVQGTQDTGYIYTYSLKRENFSKEGSYRLSLYSKDRAGNEVNNALDINGREITFTIDNTAPKVIIDGVETGKVYDVDEQTISIAVTDNFKLMEAEITLVNNENTILESWDYMELSKEGETIDVSIPMYNEELTLLYRVKDAAGNEAQTLYGEKTALTDFFVTKDKLVQFLNKPTATMFGRITIIFISSLIFVSIVSIIILIYYKKKRC